MLQTVGLSHPRYDPWRRRFAALVTVVVIGANISFPVAVLTGVLREAPPAARPAQAEAR
jgi:succinate dehydrogenase / fumarate reductase cytochrome b subunit